jgi:hypothetical protein
MFLSHPSTQGSFPLSSLLRARYAYILLSKICFEALLLAFLNTFHHTIHIQASETLFAVSWLYTPHSSQYCKSEPLREGAAAAVLPFSHTYDTQFQRGK